MNKQVIDGTDIIIEKLKESIKDDVQRIALRDEIMSFGYACADEELMNLACTVCPECRMALSKKEDWLPAERDEFRGRNRRDWYHNRAGYNGSGVCAASQIHEYRIGIRNGF